MELFDNIVRTASKAADKAVSQAKTLSEIARLRSQIAEAEHTITDCCTQIGKLYAAAHAEDADPAFADQMNTISRCEAQLQSLRKHLLDLKGAAQCPRCGAEISLGSAFCSACGAPIPKEEAKEAEIVVENAAEEPVCEPVPEACEAAPEAETVSDTEAVSEAEVVTE